MSVLPQPNQGLHASEPDPQSYETSRLLLRDVTVPTQIPDAFNIGTPDPQLAQRAKNSAKASIEAHLTSLLDRKTGKSGFEDPALCHINYKLARGSSSLEIIKNSSLDPVRRLQDLRKGCFVENSLDEYGSNLGDEIWDLRKVLSKMQDASEELEVQMAVPGGSVQFVKSSVQEETGHPGQRSGTIEQSNLPQSDGISQLSQGKQFHSRDQHHQSHRHHHRHRHHQSSEHKHQRQSHHSSSRPAESSNSRPAESSRHRSHHHSRHRASEV